jgi:hypothetical protein
MTIRYVTTGAWGAGSGTELTPAQADENVYTLSLRLAALEAAGIDATITLVQSGSTVTFYADGVSIGSITLPTSTWAHRGEWAAGATYFIGDIVTVTSNGVFLVTTEHVAASNFPGAGADYTRLYTFPNPAEVVSVSADSLILTSAHANKYVRCTNPTRCDVYIEAGVFADNTEIHFRQASTGPIVLHIGDSGTQLIPPQGRDYASDHFGATFTAKNAGSDVWDLFGDLALTT